MNRPYIICHMVTSIDGKVTGEFLGRPACEAATGIYYDIHRKTRSSGFICGRVTMEESFTGGWYPDLTAYPPRRHDGGEKMDYLVDKVTGFYAVAFDPKGRLGWQHNRIRDDDPGYDGAQIIEVLTEQVDERYLGYLEAMEIPYLFAGKKQIDVELALYKLKTILGVDTLLLEGGSVINGAFQRADVIDELSLVVAPTVAGEGKPLFTDSLPADFRLTNTRQEQDVLILSYKREA